ncbi:hypothetical protein E2320_007297 [Naja naja]|nr:hypothetical protein E2320_007297 [Naja naja]
MWVIGGYMFNHTDSQMVLAYNLESREWMSLGNSVNAVGIRYGHSIALHEIDETGNVTTELWVFHISNHSWVPLSPKAKEQYAVVGHSAHVVTLQDGAAVMLSWCLFHVPTNTWSILQTRGALVQGGYGHSSVYDENSNSIYTHGGYKAFSANKYRLTDDLYKYEVQNICGATWHLVGNSCLRITNTKDSYDNAKLACRSHNAALASLTSQKKVEFVLKELQKTQSSPKALTPWVGLRKINVSYWCWEDMSPFTNTLLRWLPGEPSDIGFCSYLAEPSNQGLKAATCINLVNGSVCERPANHSAKQCRTPCGLRTACSECTSSNSECMWCSNKKQCVDSNAYVASFPYGQCMEWHTCNGHSKCINESICERCENLTTGKHCETCISGYYGDPTNGGTCQRVKSRIDTRVTLSKEPATVSGNYISLGCSGFIDEVI